MAVLTTMSDGSAWSEDARFIPEQVIPESLMVQVGTFAGTVHGDHPRIRVPWVEPSVAQWTPEGEEIAESTPVLSEKVIASASWDDLIAVSNQMVRQYGGVNTQLLQNSLLDGLITTVDSAFMNQPAPTDGSLIPGPGILAQAHYPGGTISDNLDLIVAAEAHIIAARGQLTNVIASPSAWAKMQMIKAGTDSAMPLLGSGNVSAEKLLQGAPVTVTSACPEDTVVLLDKRAVLVGRSDVEVAVSDQVFFTRKSVALRVGIQFGVTVADMNRVVVLSTAAVETP